MKEPAEEAVSAAFRVLGSLHEARELMDALIQHAGKSAPLPKLA
jgi:hypothetical protein